MIAIAATSGGGKQEKPKTPPVTPATITITGAEDFDPQGDQEEHGEDAAAAVDDDAGTGWVTETYDAGLEGAAKNGVGLILETGESVAPAKLVMQTDGGGWRFNVYASDAKTAPTEGPFDETGAETGAWGDPIAVDGSAGKDTSVDLSGAPGRHFLIWITDLNGVEAAEIFGAQLQS